MVDLSHETEALAKRLAEMQRLSVDAAIRRALERQATAEGIAGDAPRRRMSVAEMLAVGDEIAAMPLLDPRSPLDLAQRSRFLGGWLAARCVPQGVASENGKGGETVREIARTYNVSHSTISRLKA
jgi:antitoxin VapB